MPSKTPAQARFFAAVAHGWRPPGGGGPPASIAREFNEADTMGNKLRRAMAARKAKRGAR